MGNLEKNKKSFWQKSSNEKTDILPIHAKCQPFVLHAAHRDYCSTIAVQKLMSSEKSSSKISRAIVW